MAHRIAIGLLAVVLATRVANLAKAAPADGARVKRFDATIRPILAAHCVRCHGAEAQEGALRLDIRAGVLDGGGRGPAAEPGMPDESLLIAAVRYRDDALQMPPGGRLTEEDVRALEDWVRDGLAWSTSSAPISPTPVGAVIDDAERRHWAFQTLTQVEPPEVADPRARTEIDRFILAKLTENGLAFAPDADRYTFLRRASFDLLGLPPSPEEIAEFVNDSGEDAYERLLDRLLTSPHFGERWGRHWLDNAGYSDVHGGDNDYDRIKLSENKWLYRDYVVRSFNEDKPFDRFLVEQLAGDESVDWRNASSFTPEVAEGLIATGFLCNAADDTNENELNTLDIRHGVLQRTIENVASNVLAISLQCAKCHDHKYEPLAQRDYYQFQACFQPALDPNAWVQPQQRQLPAIAPAEQRAIELHNAELDRRMTALRDRVAELKRPYEEKLRDAKLSTLPEQIRADVATALAAPADQRSEVQRYLAEKFEEAVRPKLEEIAAALSETDRAAIETLERDVDALAHDKRGWEHWQVYHEMAPPMPTQLLERGSHLSPGETVSPNAFAVLRPAADVDGLRIDGVVGSSGRRLALARWLTDVDSSAGALVVRVRVNRIWQQLFGRGIVATSDNLGLTGARPTHPEFLEWLARAFVADGQRLKPFLKRIMLSTAYRQASAVNDASRAAELDPDDSLLWRHRLRRLEAEAIRDAVLCASGNLDRTVGGPPVPVEWRPDGSFEVADNAPPNGRLRRSIYLLARRNYHLTLLAAFDQPHMTGNCTCREHSAVVQQSLAMLNDAFVLEQAQVLSQRIVKEFAADPQAQVRGVFLTILGREPNDNETAWCRDTVGSNGAGDSPDVRLARLCHTLLNTSEFLYIP